jgi:spermidine/putrescine transport system ATP-binding protein
MSMNDRTPAVELTHITKHFDSFTAVNDISMRIEQSEFFSMLGASGCGKTTTLRMIAGFEHPTSGSITLKGQAIEHQPPHRRNVNMVFQNYALFPHLNVFENVAFGLRVKRLPAATIRQQVGETLAMVQLVGMDQRKPAQLSGGQQQRVALARALVNKPAVLLLDEPLGALDQKLRKDMQLELKRLQREVKITFIYVTHDQEEALTMSDRIAVMNQGRVLQVDDPRTLYDCPQSRYVASFIGTTNFFSGRVAEVRGGEVCVEIAGQGQIWAHGPAGSQVQVAAGQPVIVSVRPERLQLNSGAANQLSGHLEDVVFVGNDLQYFVRLPNGERAAIREQNRGSDNIVPTTGDSVTISWSPASTNLFME